MDVIDLQMLPVRPRPHQRELLVGYLCRLGRANGFDDAHALCSALAQSGVHRYHIVRDGFRRVCAYQGEGLLGPAPRWSAAEGRIPESLRRDDFNHRWLRWCPHCLAESQYVRMEWGLKCFCVCPIHRAMLLEHCCCCASTQGADRSDLVHCASCGALLASMRSDAAQPALIALHQRIVRAR